MIVNFVTEHLVRAHIVVINRLGSDLKQAENLDNINSDDRPEEQF